MTGTTVSWRSVIGIWTLLALGCASGPKLPDRPLVPDQVFQQKTFPLPSGLHLLVQEDHGAPLVSVTTVVSAGSSTDPQGQEGVAHLVEHLAYRPLNERLKRAGASFNATTEPDRTTYFALAHKEQLGELLAIEGQRLARTLDGVTADVLQVERDIIRNEARERGIYPRIFSELFGRAYPGGHPLARKGAADDHLGTTTLEHAQQFVQRHYRPGNCTVVVAGDVDPVEVARIVSSQWPASLLQPSSDGAPPRPRRATLVHDRKLPPKPAAAGQMDRITLPVPGRRLLIAWPAPADVSADPFLALSSFALVLKLASASGFLTTTPAVLGSKHGSLVAIEFRLKPAADVVRFRDRVLDAINHARGDAVIRRLMEMVKWMTATSIMRNSGDLLASNRALAEHYATTGRPTFYRDTLEHLSKVDAIEVNEYMWEAFSRDRAISLLIDPPHDSAAEDVGPALVSTEPPRHDLDLPEIMNLAGKGPDELRAMVRVPGVARLPGFRLSNGLEVTLVPSPARAPVAELAVQLPIGDVDLYPFGLATLARDSSTVDCETESLLDNVGGSLRASDDQLPARYSAEVFSGNVENAMAAVAGRLRCRELSSARQARAIASLAEAGKQSTGDAKKPETAALQAFWKNLYPDEAFGMLQRHNRLLQGAREAEIEAVLRAQYQPGGARAVLVTQMNEAQLRPLLERHLGAWRADPAPSVPRATDSRVLPATRKVEVFNVAGAALHRIDFGCRLTPATEQTFPAYDLLEAIVRREASRVRSDWGATYGLEVSVVHEPRAIAHLRVRGAVEPARAADAVSRLLTYVGQLATDGPDFRHFVLERWDLGREFNRRFSTAPELAYAVLWAARRGWSPAVWDAYPQRLVDLQRSSIRDLLAPCAGKEIVTVVGDKAAVTTKLKALAVLGGP